MKIFTVSRSPICIFFWMLIFVVTPSLASSNEGPDQQLTQAESQEGGNPIFQFEVGGESFLKYGREAGSPMGGLSAIMVDMEGRMNSRFSFFGAFHFDSSVWHDFLNLPKEERRQGNGNPEVGLEVEEFFVTLHGKHFELTAGRMFSVLGYANQLHLADFQFITKPRMFTEYWGDNHGYSFDGVGLKWMTQWGGSRVSLFLEAAKNGIADENLMMNVVADFGQNVGELALGFRAFSHMNHQSDQDPLWHRAPLDYQTLYVPSAPTLTSNAFGASMNAFYQLGGQRSVFLQSEWMQRKMGDHGFSGGYAFLIFEHNARLSSSVMAQQLQIPCFTEDGMNTVDEKALTFGLSYFPLNNHRFRLEYSRHSNSDFYDNMFVAKWTFYLAP